MARKRRSGTECYYLPTRYLPMRYPVLTQRTVLPHMPTPSFGTDARSCTTRCSSPTLLHRQAWYWNSVPPMRMSGTDNAPGTASTR
eukprot:2731107-Rhodomonas_salina.4